MWSDWDYPSWAPSLLGWQLHRLIEKMPEYLSGLLFSVVHHCLTYKVHDGVLFSRSPTHIAAKEHLMFIHSAWRTPSALLPR